MENAGTVQVVPEWSAVGRYLFWQEDYSGAQMRNLRGNARERFYCGDARLARLNAGRAELIGPARLPSINPSTVGRAS